VHKLSSLAIVALAVLFAASAVHAQAPVAPNGRGGPASAQQNVPPAAQRAQGDVERTVRRYGIGVTGGVGIDPEIIHVGVHGTFGPIFREAVQFRPGLELGLGELTTLLAINLDVLYTFDNESRNSAWLPYVGAGPTFGLSHKGFDTDDLDKVDLNGTQIPVSDRNRFDFGDTDFEGGMNFIVGMRKQKKFFEMRANAWGVSSVRLVAGINF
jgi:hypothetical protein